jgi:phage I-like protein
LVGHVTEPLKLICLKTAAPQFDASKGVEGLPKRILVMPWGVNETTKGRIIVNETTLAELHAFNRSKNWDRAYFDWEHSSVPGSETYKGEPVAIAANGVSIDEGGLEVVRGEGIYALSGEYTPEGKQMLPGGHYVDLSPVVHTNDKGEVIGLHSIAFCRHGATPGLIFLSAPKPTPTSKTMDQNKPPQSADELFNALKGALKLGADATPGDVMTGLTKALSAKVELEKKVEDKPAPAADDAVKTLTATVTDLAATVKALSTTFEGTERANILSQANREGKQVPKTAEGLPLDQLKALCAELPVTVPLEKRTPDATALMLSGTGGVNPEAASVSKHTGVSDEDRKKYGGA